jgi:hypothetical protein
MKSTSERLGRRGFLGALAAALLGRGYDPLKAAQLAEVKRRDLYYGRSIQHLQCVFLGKDGIYIIK